MSPALPLRPAALPQDPDHRAGGSGAAALAALGREIEAAYLGAGQTLIEMEGRIGQMRAPLDELVARAPGVLRAVAERAGQLCLLSRQLEGDLVDRGQAVSELRRTIESLSDSVAGIARALRTMKFVAMNARIHVFSLPVRNARLESFTVSVNDLVAGSDAILSRVEAMTGEISACLSSLSDVWIPRICSDVADLRPEIEALGRDVAGFAADPRNEAAFGNALAGHMDQLGQSFDRMIVSLQTGDRASQRIDHARTILERATRERGDGALYGLGVAQLRGAYLDLRDETERILAEQAAAVERMERMAGLVGPGSGRERLRLFGTFADRVARARDRVEHIRDQRTAMLEVAETALARMSGLRAVLAEVSSLAEDLRLVGTNAVLACVDLGDDGGALREIAVQLRLLAAGASSRFRSVWTELGDSDQRLTALVEDIRDRPSRAIADLALGGASMAEDIDAVFGAARQVSDSTGGLLTSLATTLPRSCKTMHEQVDRLYALLQALSARSPDLVSGDQRQAAFDAVFALYSMDAERVIHREHALRFGLDPGPEPAPPGAANADVADFFF